jgi:hypothetical protein
VVLSLGVLVAGGCTERPSFGELNICDPALSTTGCIRQQNGNPNGDALPDQLPALGDAAPGGGGLPAPRGGMAEVPQGGIGGGEVPQGGDGGAEISQDGDAGPDGGQKDEDAGDARPDGGDAAPSADAQPRLDADVEADADGPPVDGEDAARGSDAAPPPPDAAPPPPDAAPGPQLPPGATPCEQGPGQRIIGLHWDNGSRSARVDTWDVACDYSFADQLCNASDNCRGFCDVPRTRTGAVELSGLNRIMIRFDVTGLRFNSASIHVLTRSLCAASGNSVQLEAPAHGAIAIDGVSQEFEYQWVHGDWSQLLRPGDDPGLTAVLIYDGPGGCGSLGVQAFELCIQ